MFSLESRWFPRLGLGKHQDSRENKTNYFPRDHTLSVYCFSRGVSLLSGLQWKRSFMANIQQKAMCEYMYRDLTLYTNVFHTMTYSKMATLLYLSFNNNIPSSFFTFCLFLQSLANTIDLTIGSCFSMHYRVMEHAGSLESTKEAQL